MENEENRAECKDNSIKTISKRRTVKRRAVELAECAIFAALMVAAAYIQIPFPFVPLTFQTAVCVLAGLILGAKKGAASISVYAFMGLIGIPVFTSGGGISYVLRPSFGYIIGFIAAAFVAGIIVGKKSPYSLGRCLFAAFAAFLVNYIFGVSYFIAVWQLNGYEGLLAAVLEWNIIYMPKDILLCALGAIIAWRVLPIARRGGSAMNKR